MRIKTIIINLVISIVAAFLAIVLDVFGYIDYNFTSFQLYVLCMLCWLLLNQVTQPEELQRGTK